MFRYRILPHTADVRLQVVATTKEELFPAALRGMGEIILPGFCEKQFREECVRRKQKIAVESIDFSALCVDFLSEALYWTQTEHVLFCDVHIEALTECSIRGILIGCEVSQDFEEDIKAVTYHGASVRLNDRGLWEITILFDI